MVGESGRRRLPLGASAGDCGCNLFTEPLASSLPDEVDDDESDEDEDGSGAGAIVGDCGNRAKCVGGSCWLLLDDGWLAAVVVVAGSCASCVGGAGGSFLAAILSAVTCNLMRPLAVVDKQASILVRQASL